MKNINRVYCLFEQSGTYKKVFRELGYQAWSYDLENQFNETDFQIDLFEQIDLAHENLPSIFDEMTNDDLILAFFPCTYFSVQNDLTWNKTSYNFKTWDEEKINNYIKDRKNMRDLFFRKLEKFLDVLEQRNLRCIIENPYNGNYLLKQERTKNPSLVINNRRVYGDYYKKPTMFYYINCEPTYMTSFLVMSEKEMLDINNQHGIKRSLMHRDFAVNFVNKYILGV